jgi:acyl carrier protein
MTSEVPEMSAVVQRKIIEIIAAQALLNVADVHPDSRLDSLGLDSLGLVEAIFAIEEAFDIQVPFNANTPDAQGFDITSVATIAAAVESLMAQKAA